MALNLKLVNSILEKAIGDHVFPGCVFGYTDGPGDRQLSAFGHTTYECTTAITAEHEYDVASVTKVVPTSTLALMLLDKEAIALDDAVCGYLPELAFEGAEAITIRHLLTHTLEWSFPLSQLKENTAGQILKTLFSKPLQSPAGSGFFYANATSIVLGMVIERAMREPLDRLADRLIFGPLGMRRTTFYPEQLPAETPIVPTEIDPWRKRTICGEVHDESAWRLRETMVAGSAGLFSTANDLLIFLQVILDNGEIDGYQLLSEAMIGKMQQNQIAHLGLSAGLGWELNQPRYMGSDCAAIIGKTGFTGCVIMADIRKGRAVVLLSNCTYPHRKPDAALINQVRSAVANAIFS